MTTTAITFAPVARLAAMSAAGKHSVEFTAAAGYCRVTVTTLQRSRLSALVGTVGALVATRGGMQSQQSDNGFAILSVRIVQGSAPL
jgi:hypothetical protein